jgi:hypothetical protein
MIYIYFSFFLDAFLGVMPSILIKGLIGAIFYMCRMDDSPMGRKLETFDGGFIHIECAHRHPIILVFVSHLLSQWKLRQYKSNSSHHLAMRENNSLTKIVNNKQTRSLRAIRKWQLGVFLCRNPTIVFFRKAFLKQLHIDDDNQKRNLNRRLSVYTRRMSVWQPTINSKTASIPVDENRF